MKMIIVLMIVCFIIEAKELHVMTFNVENLFDASKDLGKDDWTFLAKNYPHKKARCREIWSKKYRKECMDTHWDKSKIKLKIDQIKRVVDTAPSRPDFLAIIEIENENIAKQLAESLGYKKWIITNSADKRGIDVALLYNLNPSVIFLSSKEHFVGITRSILEANFMIDGNKRLVFYVNHWPSQRSKTKRRISVAKKLRGIIEKRDPHENVIVMGDFNTLESEKPHPFRDVLLQKKLLFDVDNLYFKNKKISFARKRLMPPGTYFYSRNMSWNKLDRIFINRSLKRKRGLYMDPGSYKIFAPKFTQTRFHYQKKSHLQGSVVEGVPWKYNFSSTTPKHAGFSDHYPVMSTIKY